jgi:hypothetical protein
MGAHCFASCSEADRSPPDCGPAGGRQCDSLSGAYRSAVAIPSGRLAALLDGSYLLPPMATRRNARSPSRPVPTRGSRSSRPRSRIQYCDCGQPVSENDRKRGRGFDTGKKMKGQNATCLNTGSETALPRVARGKHGVPGSFGSVRVHRPLCLRFESAPRTDFASFTENLAGSWGIRSNHLTCTE